MYHKLFTIFVLILIGLGIVGSIYIVKHNKELMQECMDDGKKRYECESMLNKNVYIHSN